MKRLSLLAAILSLVLPGHDVLLSPAQAQEPVIPNFWDNREQLQRPDLTAVARIRFLTTVDYPPFSYIDQNGRLGGFNVDLARAICQELGVSERCQIQGLPWDELESAIAGDGGEAILAGLAITAETRQRYAFTRPYLQFPARFVTLEATPWQEPMHAAIAGERIGVIAGSAHEQMLRDQFSGAVPVPYDNSETLYTDLREGRIAGIFGDGMRLGFWLSGANAQGCCRFAGGPYLNADYFGNGLAIAVAKEDEILAGAFDYALKEMAGKGRFAELYLRYFPTGFY